MKIYFPGFSLKAFFAMCLYVFLIPDIVFAQEKASYLVQNQNILPHQNQKITLQKAITSLSVQFDENKDFEGFSIYAADKKYFIAKDADAENRNGMCFSQLIIFPAAIKEFVYESGEYSGQAQFHLLQVPYISFDKNAFRQKRNKKGCEKPVTMDQDVWRAGLASPTVPPTATKVAHIIVHHTATSNTDSNYVNVVRNIYLYHTQVNGWDDIGYNFLVAPDGTVFQGRDGMGQMEDDDVKGAHFCNKNTNTMGISMIGDYQAIAPTDTALFSLERLIAWKLNKENLLAMDSAIHPTNDPAGYYLKRISGHRDGCSTECPGDSVYFRLPQIRNAVEVLMQDCTPPTVGFSESKHFPADAYMAYNSQNQTITIENLQAGNYDFVITDMQGRIRMQGKNASAKIISVYNLPKGFYVIQLYNAASKNALRFVKI